MEQPLLFAPDGWFVIIFAGGAVCVTGEPDNPAEDDQALRKA